MKAEAKSFTINAVVENPVGSAPHRDHDALRDFYRAATDSVEKMVLEGNLRVREKWGACGMHAYPKGMDLKFCITDLPNPQFSN